MACGPTDLAAQKRRRKSSQVKPQQHRGTSKGTRRSSRIAAQQSRRSSRISAKQEALQKGLVSTRKRAQDPETHTSTERPRKRLQTRNNPQMKSDEYAQKKKRPREDEVAYPPEPPSKRERTSSAAFNKARINFWTKNNTWPAEDTMNRLGNLVNDARARRRSLSRKRSNTSLNTETTQTQSNQQPRDQTNAPYNHPMFEEQLKDCGSFMDGYKEGITAESTKLCEALLNALQPPPEHTVFSDDEMHRKTCKRIRGENETKVIRYIAELIVPSPEKMADEGADHLDILRETTNACWTNSIPFLNRSGSRPSPRPQPDFSVGFKRDAFSRKQLEKLQPYTGDLLVNYSWFAAIYNMYLPFLSSEVKCGAVGLDIADRQNAHTQSVILRGVYKLFRLVGRENELHREINGFSISHSDVDVRIFGHYAVINGNGVEFYRHSIAEFSIAPTMEEDKRWKANTFVRNLYDLWVPKQFERLCSVIDNLPADSNFDGSEHDQELASSHSGLSQRLEEYSLANVIPDTQSNEQPVTPEITQTSSSNSKKAKRKQ
ncbi:uncharacterized protein BDZ99DRAFT_491919 [Mytilinidion resinicola]|uniref:DUF7924 domain-containing protein n=1 Tax=Mytilinidion resinicola TaxID=574789 RepID=A0A6A6Y514_9PEZI|nr:uncharacterized protein BDZ99DRAFT_491919 [Mytilinidion resinicola]KAF2802877.1 hypothetical protein BDZ99DRAFT_491919 [Mytilinidion resinicola]